MENTKREIIVYKINALNNPEGDYGFLKPVFERIDGKFIALNKDNFCKSEAIFVTSHYSEIDKKYGEFRLFSIIVSETQEEEREGGSKYITQGYLAKPLQENELVEIIHAPLPNPNNPFIDVNSLPSTHYIYLVHDDCCYGLFKWQKDNDSQHSVRIQVLDSKMPGKEMSPRNGELILAGEFSKVNQFRLNAQLVDRQYFYNLKTMHEQSNFKPMDYFSDDKIFNYFGALLQSFVRKGNNLTFNEIEAIIKNKMFYLDSKTTITSRLNRLKEIFNKYEAINNNINELFPKDNVNKIMPALLEDFGAKKESHHTIFHKNKNAKNPMTNHSTKKEESKKLDEDIQNKKIRLKELSRDIDNKEKTNKELKDNHEELANLKKQLEDKRNEFKELDESLGLIREEICETQKSIQIMHQQSNRELKERLLSFKSYSDVVFGNFGNHIQIKSKDIFLKCSDLNKNHTDNAEKIIQYVRYKLSERRRYFSQTDVINLVVLLQQSFIFFLAGSPGGGKTTLVRIMSDIYGIRDKRFVDVPVARGWTGQKDFIGYHNPFSNSFQPSNTGLYEFFTALDKEDKSKPTALSWVLLDEANLSSIEYYWSSFMGMTDSKEDKTLRLGNEDISISDGLRFIATMNYDNTTESLSERLIDRAPIMVLESNDFHHNSYNQSEIKKINLTMPLSYKDMDNYFGNSLKPELTEKEQSVFDEIKYLLSERDIKKGTSIFISHRKEDAIKQYCNKARQLMQKSFNANELTAMDYAVLQFVLPLIRGRGNYFQERLKQLNTILEKYHLERSSKYLKDIIDNGATNIHTYDFFCW